MAEIVGFPEAFAAALAEVAPLSRARERCCWEQVPASSGARVGLVAATTRVETETGRWAGGAGATIGPTDGSGRGAGQKPAEQTDPE